MTVNINGCNWHIKFVPWNSRNLLRSNGTLTVGVTDVNTGMVYLSDRLQGSFLRKVLCHELCHCAIWSYGIDLTLDEEELLCDFIATYSDDIISLTNDIFSILKERVA